jgi:hypothetical protein
MNLLSLIWILSTVECSSPLISINFKKMDKLQSKNHKPFTYRIIQIPKSNQNRIRVKTSAVILTKYLEDINEFNKKANLTNDYPEKMKFIVTADNSEKDLNLKHYPLTFLNGHIVQFEYFLKNRATKIELSTFEYFSKDTCTVNQTLLNTFDKKTQKWKKELKYQEKFMNFNKCEMPIGITNLGSHESYYIEDELIGFVIDFADILGQKGNFLPIYEPMNFEEMLFVKNEFEVMNIYLKIYFTIAFYSTFNKRHYHITKTFKQYEEVFIISESEAYNSYEKLILPFDESTWFLLIFTFGLAFFVIFIARYLPQKIRNRIYGRGINAPAFNVVGTFFGIGQVRLPVENIPRFILMCFILFCLIIRTAYQGVQFDMMTKDMRKPLPKTIYDLYVQNYTIIIEERFKRSTFSFKSHIIELLGKSEM